MSVFTVIHKIGDEIISVVEWPFSHALKLEHILVHDVPEVRAALVGVVQRIESMSPDIAKAVNDKGINIPEDLKAFADLKALYEYFVSTVVPAIEDAYKDVNGLKGNLAPEAGAAVATVAAATATELQHGPGLHNTVPA